MMDINFQHTGSFLPDVGNGTLTGLSHLGIEVEQIGRDEAGQRRTFGREDALFQGIMGHLIGKRPWQRRGSKAGEDLKDR